MKRIICFVLCMYVFSACSSEPVPTDPMDYVGMYEYKTAHLLNHVSGSGDYIATNHDGDCLILKPSGEYIFLQGGTTKAMSETRGQWRLTSLEYPNTSRISLDSHGYPIRVKEGKIRLLVNDDLGVWYEKFSDSIPLEE